MKKLIFLSPAVFLIFALPVNQVAYNYQATIAQPTWTLQSKIADAKTLLQQIPLQVGTEEINYTEDRVAQNSAAGMVSSTRQLHEVDKQISLAVLNPMTGDLKTVVIDKRGEDLIAPAGWNIEVLPRPNGIRWNAWNTAWRVNTPTGYVVIADVYPDDQQVTVPQRQGRKTVYVTQQVVDYVFYSPYSPDLHSDELVNDGRKYIHDTVSQALADLKSKNIVSRAEPRTLVADLFAPRAETFAQIPLLENTDPAEFLLDPQSTVQRVETIIGANTDAAFGKTCNGVSACGWVQFTPKTYASIAKLYPSAQLITDFKTGAANNQNSMEAAILLYDENLRSLIHSNGSGIVNDPKLSEYLAASYNGNPIYARNTLAVAILSAVSDWMNALSTKNGGLRSETQTYLVKLRYLEQNNLP